MSFSRRLRRSKAHTATHASSSTSVRPYAVSENLFRFDVPGEDLEGLFYHLWKSTDPESSEGAVGILISSGNHIQAASIDYKAATHFIGGFIQVGPAPSRGIMLADEDGLRKELPPNDLASRLAGYRIVGNAIYVPKEHARKALRGTRPARPRRPNQ